MPPELLESHTATTGCSGHACSIHITQPSERLNLNRNGHQMSKIEKKLPN